jgi:hypothetical protein
MAPRRRPRLAWTPLVAGIERQVGAAFDAVCEERLDHGFIDGSGG